MRKINQLLGLSLLSVLAACATTGDGATWECSATGLVNAYYTGSGTANVHLQGYSTGGNYAVTLNESRTEATGTTANGTPFKCVKAK